MTDIICPLCGKPNPPELEECKFCQAPLKAAGFLASSDQEGQGGQVFPSPAEFDKAGEQTVQPKPASPLEQAIPDWLKDTEANFLESSEAEPEKQVPDDLSAQLDALLNPPPDTEILKGSEIDDDWLASLLAEAGGGEFAPVIPPEEQAADAEVNKTFTESSAEEEGLLPADTFEKPDWLTSLEAASPIKLEGELGPSESLGRKPGAAELGEASMPSQVDIPEWIGHVDSGEIQPVAQEAEAGIAPAELPNWLEALRPDEEVSASEPIEDLSAAEVVTAGPLSGLRGVISAHPSAIRARKPPTYSIKLRVTDEQRARVEMMEALLANEQKPKPLAAQPILSSRNIFRLVIAAALILPIVWMVITGSQRIPPPQPGDVPGVVEFNQQIQTLPNGEPLLLAFDYEAGFSGEMKLAVSTLLTQLMNKNAYLTLVTTTPSGPALAESIIKTNPGMVGQPAPYSNYTDLGYIPGGTLGLLGLAISPRTVLPYALDSTDVWVIPPLDTIVTINDFSAVILLTNDPGTARSWIEQVGPVLKEDGTPLLIVTSSQAEPLIRPYFQANPRQVQGMVAGLAGGMAYSRTIGNTQQSGIWDAYSVGVSAAALIILIGSVLGVTMKMQSSGEKKES